MIRVIKIIVIFSLLHLFVHAFDEKSELMEFCQNNFSVLEQLKEKNEIEKFYYQKLPETMFASTKAIDFIQKAGGDTLENVIDTILNKISGDGFNKEINYFIKERMILVKINPSTLKSIDKVKGKLHKIKMRVPVMEGIEGITSKIGFSLQGIMISENIFNALNGDDRSAIKAVANSVSLQVDLWVRKLGSRSLGVALGGVLLIDYVLQEFITDRQEKYHDFWWNAYSIYYNKNYSKIVSGSNSWVSLAEAEGIDGIRNRLEEFWKDPDEHAVNFYKIPGPFERNALAIASFKRPFASRYFNEYLLPSLKNYYRKKAEEAKEKLFEDAVNSYSLLKSEIEVINIVNAFIEKYGKNSIHPNIALYNAIESKDVSLVHDAINNNADINALNKDGRTPIIHAIMKRSINIVKILVTKGADSNRPDKDGMSPLMYAVWNRMNDMVEYLLSVKVDAFYKTPKGSTALFMAESKNYTELIKMLKEYLWKKISVNEFLEASFNGNYDIVLKYLERGRNPNFNKDSITALMFASYNGHKDIVNLLLSYGADPDVKDSNGFTAMHHSSYKNNIDIARLLVKKGAKILKDNQGNYPGYYFYWNHGKNRSIAKEFGYSKPAHQNVSNNNSVNMGDLFNAFAKGFSSGVQSYSNSSSSYKKTTTKKLSYVNLSKSDADRLLSTKSKSNFSPVNKKNTGWEETYYSNGKIKERYYVVNGVKNGQYYFYRESGKIAEEYVYVNGKREGLTKGYHGDGTLNYTGYVKNGRDCGVWTYYRNGKPVKTENRDLRR